MAYTLAGADCIDVAADRAVINAAKEGIETAKILSKGDISNAPWLMVSLNDGEDPHFRKAKFDPNKCPSDCPRPCERICPAQAISFSAVNSGIIEERCYGCGRCLPVCPSQLIYTLSHVATAETIAPLIVEMSIDAIEIHTQVGHLQDFTKLFAVLSPWLKHLKVLAISCPDASGSIEYLKSLYDVISPLPCPLIWQTDGRPMSGDIGIGATRAAVKLAQKVLAAQLPGYIQLAGGTNQHTVPKLKALGLLNERKDRAPTNSSFVAGIAYGSYARSLLSPILDRLETLDRQNFSHDATSLHLENYPDLFDLAVTKARDLVSQIKIET